LIVFAAVFLTQIYLASALTISSVDSNPNEVQPGEKFSLDLKIENNLDEDINNVVVSLTLNNPANTLPFAPYQSSNEVRIDNIDKDDSERADFDLTAFSNAVSGTYLIPVQISYELSNGTPVQNEPLGLVSVIINAKPNIEVSSEGSVLIKGREGKMIIKIVNSGLGDAKFLSISLGSVVGVQATSSDKVYIGNIDSNDFDNAEFSVFIDVDAPSSFSLPVKIVYSDSKNHQITDEKTILIKSYTQQEAINLGLIKKNNTSLIIISIAAGVIIFLIYRAIRKRNRNKRNGQ